MSAPEWMQRAARTNPVVSAYLRMWNMSGTSDYSRAAFFETLAKELAQSNEDLRKRATECLTRAPASIVVQIPTCSATYRNAAAGWGGVRCTLAPGHEGDHAYGPALRW